MSAIPASQKNPPLDGRAAGHGERRPAELHLVVDAIERGSAVRVAGEPSGRAQAHPADVRPGARRRPQGGRDGAARLPETPVRDRRGVEDGLRIRGLGGGRRRHARDKHRDDEPELPPAPSLGIA
jgi:hypothetical protein